MYIQDTSSSGECLGMWWTGRVARVLGFPARTIEVQEGTQNTLPVRAGKLSRVDYLNKHPSFSIK